MIQSLRKIIIHPFVLAIIPITFFVSFIHEIPMNYLIIPILIISIGISFFWILLREVFKDGQKAGIVLSFLLILFIGFEYLHIGLFGIEVGGINVGNYFILLIPFSTIFILGMYYLIKTKNRLNNISKILNIFSIVLILATISYVGINNLESNESNNYKNFELLSLPDSEQTNLPDIYYIILDEYAGTASLQKDFNFDNSEFILALSERGFYIPSTNYSNYPYTLLSVSSTINMQYLNFLTDKFGTESTDKNPIYEIEKKNIVMKNLKSKGYHITSFYAGGGDVGSTQFVNEKLCGEDYIFNQLRSLIMRFTPISYLYPLQVHHDKSNDILCTFSELPKVKDRISQPIYVYAHMMIPHGPYVFDADGNSVTYDSTNIDQSTKKKFYLEQLKFTNKKIIETIDTILSKSQKQPIIIIQSDHGERTGIDWDNPTNEMIKQGLNNLNAYYLPNGVKNSPYDTISPVNIFRIIFNEYFNANFELLDDKYYWAVSDDKPYDLRNVTKILNEYK